MVTKFWHLSFSFWGMGLLLWFDTIFQWTIEVVVVAFDGISFSSSSRAQVMFVYVLCFPWGLFCLLFVWVFILEHGVCWFIDAYGGKSRWLYQNCFRGEWITCFQRNLRSIFSWNMIITERTPLLPSLACRFTQCLCTNMVVGAPNLFAWWCMDKMDFTKFTFRIFLKPNASICKRNSTNADKLPILSVNYPINYSSLD